MFETNQESAFCKKAFFSIFEKNHFCNQKKSTFLTKKVQVIYTTKKLVSIYLFSYNFIRLY